MSEKAIFTCACGWQGIPFIKHSFVPNDKFTHYTKSFHCLKCHDELFATSNAIDKACDVQEISLPVKEMPLPYKFTGEKYELEIFEKQFTIYSLDITDVYRKPYFFKAEGKVECYGEVFYEAVLKMENVSSGMKVGFNLEFRIPEKEIDSFCEFLLKHYEMETRQSIPRPRKLPANPGNPPPWDPNSLPWKMDPKIIPTPYYPTKKRIDPYGGNVTDYLDEIKKQMKLTDDESDDLNDIFKKYKM